jgi:hypothetical protein
MPIYCYVTDDGDTCERIFGFGEAPETVRIGGNIARRDWGAESISLAVKSGSCGSSGTWPMECVASGVHASQANELRELLKKNGCPTEVKKNGNPVYTSKRHRDKALKIRGMHDNNSFS